MEMSQDTPSWTEKTKITPEKLILARTVLEEVKEGRLIKDAVRRHPLSGGGYIAKNMLVRVYRQLTDSGEWNPDPGLLARIRMKPVRTLSGVTTVTVLTKPYPCPGQCVFCPDDICMPKSYLPDEPGAMRGLQHKFDPYEQVQSRLIALQDVGHPVEKIELLILGGTWHAYPQEYQEWFIRRCFDALNGRQASSLLEAQFLNQTAKHRNVGLVIETRPDSIDIPELVNLRRLGVTKVQMGAQSLDDRILLINKRGHTVEETLNAVNLLRATGFKIVLHWMPNLFGATLESDKDDFFRLWQDFCPDEIKIYPTQLLQDTELYQLWLKGEYQPYTTQELIHLIADLKVTIPRYCRVNRIIRDIPSNHVVDGNKRTSLRQDVQAEMKSRGTRCHCIRCREVRAILVQSENISLQDMAYTTPVSDEHFLSFDTLQDKVAGFLRLSLPKGMAPETGIPEIESAAMIREVHVYGQSLAIGSEKEGAAQHIGLGSQMVQQAELIASQKGYQRLAVISAIGTREYYSKLGFSIGDFYMVKEI
jgi:elongator complex protein 3